MPQIKIKYFEKLWLEVGHQMLLLNRVIMSLDISRNWTLHSIVCVLFFFARHTEIGHG